MADSFPKDRPAAPHRGTSTDASVRAPPDTARHRATTQRPSHTIAPAANTVSCRTAPGQRHQSAKARQPSAWRPCGCRAWSRLVWCGRWLRRASPSLQRCLTPPIPCADAPRLLSTHDLSSGHLPWGERKARARRQRAQVHQSRTPWQRNAHARGDQDRALRPQLARVQAARDQATPALQEAHARLRQRASQTPAVAVLPTVDGGWRSRRLFGEARLGGRAVWRVLTLLAHARGLTTAPWPHTLSTWVMRLSSVRIQAARGLRGLPLRQAPCSQGRSWSSASRRGLGTGTL